jgi:hypothetical protein
MTPGSSLLWLTLSPEFFPQLKIKHILLATVLKTSCRPVRAAHHKLSLGSTLFVLPHRPEVRVPGSFFLGSWAHPLAIGFLHI